MKPIVSENTRLRHKEHFTIGNFSVVDDFCYFSTKIKIGEYCHIASGCAIAGGEKFKFTMGDYSSISSGVRIWCASNDYVNDIVVLNPEKKNLGENPIEGDVRIGSMCAVGANTVIMPKNTIPDGTVIGALSFVPPNFRFKPWSVYAGIPIKFIKKRNKKNVLKQVQMLQK